MNLVYGALLLHSAGKPVTEDGVRKIAHAIDSKVEDAQIKALVAALDGVNIDEAISKAAMPVAAAPVAQTGEQKAEKKEEVSEEDKQKQAESAAEGLSSLFG